MQKSRYHYHHQNRLEESYLLCLLPPWPVIAPVHTFQQNSRSRCLPRQDEALGESTRAEVACNHLRFWSMLRCCMLLWNLQNSIIHMYCKEGFVCSYVNGEVFWRYVQNKRVWTCKRNHPHPPDALAIEAVQLQQILWLDTEVQFQRVQKIYIKSTSHATRHRNRTSAGSQLRLWKKTETWIDFTFHRTSSVASAEGKQ